MVSLRLAADAHQSASGRAGFHAPQHLSMHEESGPSSLRIGDIRRKSITEHLSDLFIHEQDYLLHQHQGGQSLAASASAGATSFSLVRVPSADSQCSPPSSPVFLSPMQHDAPRETYQERRLDAGCDPPSTFYPCLLYTSPSPRDKRQSRMPSSA